MSFTTPTTVGGASGIAALYRFSVGRPTAEAGGPAQGLDHGLVDQDRAQCVGGDTSPDRFLPAMILQAQYRYTGGIDKKWVERKRFAIEIVIPYANPLTLSQTIIRTCRPRDPGISRQSLFEPGKDFFCIRYVPGQLARPRSPWRTPDPWIAYNVIAEPSRWTQ